MSQAQLAGVWRLDRVLYGIGMVAGACSSVASHCANAGYVTRSAWGHRLRAAWRYAGLAYGVLLSPVMSRAHDVKVWSADGLFNEGLRYVAELGWTNTFCGTCNNARDRDFVSLSAGLRF